MNNNFIKKPKKLFYIFSLPILLMVIIILNIDTYRPSSGKESYKKALSSIKSKIKSKSSGSSSNRSSSSSYSSCTSGGAKSFAKQRVKSTIGMVQFLDLHRDLGNKWLFYGSAYSSSYQRDVTIWVLVSCSNGNYDVENVDVDI